MLPKQVGDIGEAACLTRLLMLGYKVLIPFGEGHDFDLVYYDDGKFIRAQVKVAWADGPSICFGSRKRGLAEYTDVAQAEIDRQAAWDLNVVGTQNFARASKFLGAKLVYLSTDYVFDGVSGSYEPWDAPNPFNYYGVTKLAGECVARSAIASLIIRTSFQPSVFPHSRVVDDLWTSADYVDVIAKKLVDILPYTGIYHLGTGRKLLKDLIHQRNPDVETIRREDIKDVRLPWDVSFGKVPHMDWEMG